MALTKRQAEAGLANLRKGHQDSDVQRRRRLLQLDRERAAAAELELEGFEVYSPTVVCDRIGVRDGKVYFVEFKKPGQELRPGQQRIHDLVPDNYLIRYGE